MKKRTRKTGLRTVGDPVPVFAGDRAKRPWALILLGAAAFGLVLLLQLDVRSKSGKERPEGKVYSAAADQFQPMAVSSHQTGLIEPPGVAKPLHLHGVKVGRTAKEGLAVLGAAEASSRTYVAGALLENGARLVELYSDHVVLTRAGRRFVLYLPQAGKIDSVARTSASDLTLGGFAAAAPPLSTPAVRVSDAIRIAPAYEGDQIVGYQIYPGAKAGQMERWGLKSGDVLVSISGQPLNSAEQVETAMEQLAEGASMQGEVRRGQERLSVTLDGSTLIASAPSGPQSPPPMP